MTVSQIHTLVNTALEETTGVSARVAEDLGDLVDVGSAVFNANAVDNYAHAIVNVIGRDVFVDRPYKGKYTKLMKDGWTYGSVMRKIRVELMEATENESWELTAGASYDPNIFTPPTVHEKFFNKRTSFEVPISLTEMQIRESFRSAEDMNRFIGLVQTLIGNTLEKATENLGRRCLNNIAAETVYSEYQGAALNSKSGVKAINLLYEYNNSGLVATPITAAVAVLDPDFIRFAIQRMAEVKEYLSEYTTIYNMGGTDKHTPEDRLNVFMLTKFATAAKTYLQSDTYNKELVELPDSEKIGFWQATGTGSSAFDFANVSTVQVTTVDNHSQTITGLLAIMIDQDAALICNDDRRITTGYNPRGEFYNYWHKRDAQYLNDYDENCVVFFVA